MAPPRIPEQSKVCIGCGTTFVRHRLPSGPLLSNSTWKKQVYCSHLCHVQRRPRIKRWDWELSLEESLRKWVVPLDEDQCWLWSGPQRGVRSKYGTFNRQKVRWSAHRAAWVIENGEIPKGLYVCHHCDTPLCCNPKHMFLGTHDDNMADMTMKGRKLRRKRPI